MKHITKGVYVAMATPMHDDESLNIEELHRQIDRFIDSGIDALFCLGTNGEFYALDRDEKYLVMRETMSHAAGRIPVYIGAGATTTRESLILTEYADKLGVQGVSVVTPYYVSLSQEQLMQHYRDVAGATSLPIILYNIPSRTQHTIEPETACELADIDNIVAIKDSSGSLESIRRFINETPIDFRVMVGPDSLIVEGLRSGAWGSVSGLANICPCLVASIYDLYMEGRIDEAEKAQAKLATLRGMLVQGNPNSIAKMATNIVGHKVGPPRAPATVSQTVVDLVTKVLQSTLDLETDV
jgi:4-hydroxy-tetrahydrodipicolinate synthase